MVAHRYSEEAVTFHLLPEPAKSRGVENKNILKKPILLINALGNRHSET